MASGTACIPFFSFARGRINCRPAATVKQGAKKPEPYQLFCVRKPRQVAAKLTSLAAYLFAAGL
jgi:hypothetical protein